MRQEALLAFMLDSESGGREFVDVLLVDPGPEPIHRHLLAAPIDEVMLRPGMTARGDCQLIDLGS